jgi:deoxyxylulose-5-phosphate synthase
MSEEKKNYRYLEKKNYMKKKKKNSWKNQLSKKILSKKKKKKKATATTSIKCSGRGAEQFCEKTIKNYIYLSILGNFRTLA